MSLEAEEPTENAEELVNLELEKDVLESKKEDKVHTKQDKKNTSDNEAKDEKSTPFNKESDLEIIVGSEKEKNDATDSTSENGGVPTESAERTLRPEPKVVVFVVFTRNFRIIQYRN